MWPPDGHSGLISKSFCRSNVNVRHVKNITVSSTLFYWFAKLLNFLLTVRTRNREAEVFGGAAAWTTGPC